MLLHIMYPIAVNSIFTDSRKFEKHTCAIYIRLSQRSEDESKILLKTTQEPLMLPELSSEDVNYQLDKRIDVKVREINALML